MSVRRSVLPSGLRIVTEEVPSVRSAAIGIWVNVGSRDETPAVAGASHFLEHLLFKGTKRRNALEISSSIESVGGEMNAFTSKEYTCFYARVIDTDLPMAIDVVSDLLFTRVLPCALPLRCILSLVVDMIVFSFTGSFSSVNTEAMSWYNTKYSPVLVDTILISEETLLTRIVCMKFLYGSD